MTLYKCDLCSYESAHRNAIRKHMAGYHANEQKACSICGKVFKCDKYLKRHTLLVHGDKTFHCQFCLYSTANRAKLGDHVRTQHTQRNYKPFKCSYCEFVCATSNNCLKHVRNKHRGEKPACVQTGVIPPASAVLDSLESGDVSLEQQPEDDRTASWASYMYCRQTLPVSAAEDIIAPSGLYCL